MDARVHMGFAIIASLAVTYENPKSIIYTPIVVLGSLLPDIDTPFSKLGKYNPVSPFMRHRGITHTLIATLIVTVVGIAIKPFIGLCLGAGYISHLFLDSLTPHGIKWFYPFKK